MNAIECRNLSCHRPQWSVDGPSEVREVSAEFAPGTLHGIHGPDGCGKGLLLNLFGLLEPPDSGDLFLLGNSHHEIVPEDRADFRNEAFGFLFTHPYLLPSFTVAENVAMPLFKICGTDAREARERTLEVLEFSGITHLEETLAGKLDAASQWRTAFARALVHNPGILIAISPSGADILLPLARHAVEQTGLCVLWTGEEESLTPHAGRLISMKAGELLSDTVS